MPPKKTRAAAAAQPISASQPEPPKPTRASGRKRRHSDGSDVSEAVSQASSTAVKTAVKRQKKSKAKATIEPELIVEEEEEVMENEVTGPICDAVGEQRADEENELDDSIQVARTSTKHSIEVSQSTSRQVHFDNPQSDDSEKATATNITPHPRKMAVKRRTLSPNLGGTTKRVKTSRTSLPPTLTQAPDEDPAQVIQEWQFAPLRNVLEERIRQLTRQKQEASGSEMPEDEDEEMADEEMLVLDTQDEIAYPQLPSPISSQTPSASGERAIAKVETGTEESIKLRSSWSTERQAFHDAILALEKDANAAKADLQILKIELEALGFPGESAPKILQSIRDSFDDVRDFLDVELPGTTPDDATNQDLVEILIANLKEFAGRLRTADKELLDKGTLSANLGHQVQGLLDHLAEKEVKNRRLTEQWEELDNVNEDKTLTITELQDQIHSIQNERDDRETELDTEIERTNDLQAEKEEFEKTVERLTGSLEQYRTEESRLTDLITKMEEEHGVTVGKMNREREETIGELEERLDAETTARDQASSQADERHATISGLEVNMQTLETERDALVVELDEVKAERDAEIVDKDAAELELEEKNAAVADLEGRVDRLEEELEELNIQLETLRNQMETERQQREAAEADLDEQTEKLHEAGKEANELRMKIYELQTKTTQVEQDMSDRDQQFQDDMAAEVQRREVADELAEHRAGTITELQTRLETVEQGMKNLLDQKDEQIEDLERDAVQKDAVIQDLNEMIRSAEDVNHRKNETIEELEGAMVALQETISGHEDTIRDLQQQARDDEEDSATAIADLNDEITKLESEKQDLNEQKAGFERRIETEAEEMLQIQNALADEAEALKTAIEDKQNKIQVVEEKACEADKSWQAVLDAREDTIAALGEQHEEIKRQFQAYVRRSTDTIGNLQQQLDNAKTAIDHEGETFKDEAEDLLLELEALVPPKEIVATHSAAVQQKAGAEVKKTKGRKKKGVVNGEVVGDESGMVEA